MLDRWQRFVAILLKEFIQMRRDKMTFAMMIGLPIMQLLMFGYAINSDPRQLPTLIQAQDVSRFSRSFIAQMGQSDYFDMQGLVHNEQQAQQSLRQGKTSFVITIPRGFERKLMRGQRPRILLTADATDPAATRAARNAVTQIANRVLRDETSGPLAAHRRKAPAFDVQIHASYNPAGESSFNIVPGLLAVILSMTMVMITAIAIVREKERGTMETLLATPARPLEIMAGKVLPYVVVGYVQTLAFLAMALYLFDVPFRGSALAFVIAVNVFLLVNLTLGYLFSTIARNQMQAMQMSFFYILPSILLSGFMFPFAAMPAWAQALGTALPSTHFMRIVRKIMLKNASLPDVSGDIGILILIIAIIASVSILRSRDTLD